MDGTTGIQPTYNLADRGCTDGFGFGGSGIWLFAILALMWGGNGMFGSRGQPPQDYARQSDVVYTSAFNQLQDENTAIRSDIQRAAYDTVSALKDGYYKVNGTLTFTVPTQGEVGVGIYKDSVLIPSAISSLTASTDTTYTLNVNGVFRVTCCDSKPTISLINTGVAITLTNTSLIIQG